jgi:hypothetical protein
LCRPACTGSDGAGRRELGAHRRRPSPIAVLRRGRSQAPRPRRSCLAPVSGCTITLPWPLLFEPDQAAFTSRPISSSRAFSYASSVVLPAAVMLSMIRLLRSQIRAAASSYEPRLTPIPGSAWGVFSIIGSLHGYSLSRVQQLRQPVEMRQASPQSRRSKERAGSAAHRGWPRRPVLAWPQEVMLARPVEALPGAGFPDRWLLVSAEVGRVPGGGARRT